MNKIIPLILFVLLLSACSKEIAQPKTSKKTEKIEITSVVGCSNYQTSDNNVNVKMGSYADFCRD